MIESAMYFAIGFLAASLLGLVFIPFVHSRAVRLTMRRVQAAAPLSMAEIQADKDQLRAEFAMSTRRLEISLEHMRAKGTGQLAELGKKSDAISRLKAELSEKNTTIRTLEASERAVKDQLRATEEEITQRLTALREAERNLAGKEAELAKLSADLDERALAADSQRIEMIALNTQIEALRSRLGESEHALKEAEQHRAREHSEAMQTRQALTHERDGLSSRILELEQQTVAQTAESTRLRSGIEELQSRLVEQDRVLMEREQQLKQTGSELGKAQKVEAELRAELAALADWQDTAVQELRKERKLMQDQLDRAITERASLQRDLSNMRRDNEALSAEERAENGLLREEISGIAAEIAHLTAALEGTDSPIAQILSAHEQASSGPTPGSLDADTPSIAPSRPGGNLADRIRALQARAGA